MFWMEAIRKIIEIMPEKVYLLSMESLRGFPSDNEEKKKSNKKRSRKGKKGTPKNDNGNPCIIKLINAPISPNGIVIITRIGCPNDLNNRISTK